jgi:FMN phosphatase YigB (HAD superfamily)
LHRECDVLFDLDDTLYPEEAFLFAVFGEIGRKFYPGQSAEVSAFLENEFRSRGRVRLYDKLLDCHPCPGLDVKALLDVQRAFMRPGFLKPYPWFSSFCAALPHPRKIRVLTNGTPVQQENKVRSLDLAGLDVEIDAAYANTRSPKPSADCLELFPGFGKSRPAVYVGDSEVDREFARNCGMEFYDVSALVSGKGDDA